MANWDKLNKEFDEILNNISDEEWNDWYNNIDRQKDMYQLQILLDAKMQSEKIRFNKISGNLIIDELFTNESMEDNSNIEFSKSFLKGVNKVKAGGEKQYALAA